MSDPLKRQLGQLGQTEPWQILATRFPCADLSRCPEFWGLDRTVAAGLGTSQAEGSDGPSGSFFTPTSVFWRNLAFFRVVAC